MPTAPLARWPREPAVQPKLRIALRREPVFPAGCGRFSPCWVSLCWVTGYGVRDSRRRMQPGMLEDKFRWLRSKPVPPTRCRLQKSAVPSLTWDRYQSHNEGFALTKRKLIFRPVRPTAQLCLGYLADPRWAAILVLELGGRLFGQVPHRPRLDARYSSGAPSLRWQPLTAYVSGHRLRHHWRRASHFCGAIPVGVASVRSA